MPSYKQLVEKCNMKWSIDKNLFKQHNDPHKLHIVIVCACSMFLEGKTHESGYSRSRVPSQAPHTCPIHLFKANTVPHVFPFIPLLSSPIYWILYAETQRAEDMRQYNQEAVDPRLTNPQFHDFGDSKNYLLHSFAHPEVFVLIVLKSPLFAKIFLKLNRFNLAITAPTGECTLGKLLGVHTGQWPGLVVRNGNHEQFWHSLKIYLKESSWLMDFDLSLAKWSQVNEENLPSIFQFV